ncbi:hypothetical protein KY284_034128 [Solanum tuberosum]|nr:hypothetical protein KY284_034128 [Solanum tuberosum]
MMAAKANPNSLFLSSSSSTHYSSFPFHQISLKKVSFLVDFQGRKLVFACSKKPIPGSVNLDPSISNSGSGSSKNDSDGASSSPSNAIDFLTLCHSLKFCVEVGAWGIVGIVHGQTAVTEYDVVDESVVCVNGE